MTQTVNLYLHDSTKFCYVTQRCYALLTFFRCCKPFEPFSPFFSALLFLLQVQFTRIMNVKHLPALSGTNLCCHIHDIIFCFLLIIIFNWVILRNGVLLQISWVMLVNLYVDPSQSRVTHKAKIVIYLFTVLKKSFFALG